MDGNPEHPLICRACLRILENRSQGFGYIEDANGNLKDMLMCCVPEMDIYVSPNPILCFPCIQQLVTVYNFKTKCLNTETIIRSYAHKNNLLEYNQINLSCIIEDLIKFNNHQREVQYREMKAHEQQNSHVPRFPYDRYPGELVPPNCSVPRNLTSEIMHENALRNHVQNIHMQGVSPDVMMRHRAMIENEFFLRQQAIIEHQRMLQNLPVNPAMDQDGAPLVPQVLMEEDQDVESRPTKEVAQNQTIQDKETGVEDGDKQGKCKTESEVNEAKEKDEFAVPVPSQESVEDVNKTSTSEGTDTKMEGEEMKDCVEKNRPRLIIKICKNRITIPANLTNKNEDSSEKENEETPKNEMSPPPPPLDVAPPVAPHPQGNDRQEVYQCSNCMYVTTHLNSYTFHKNGCTNDIRRKCPHCPHVTNRQYALNKHINTMHTKTTWYSCDLCPYLSTDTSCLRRHKRNVHPDKLENDLACHLCVYRCSTMYHYKKHMQKHEDNTSVLQCQFCSYSTRDRSNFRKHVFIHNPRALECEFCNYKSVSPYQMKIHLKKFHNGAGMEDVDCRSEVSLSEVVEDISTAIKEQERLVGHKTE
ncbi:hypothetical protein NQ315_002399 [Exocentrus adspersus]|uniref:C2H2-type domain-containing protein n=1 Tax=Exocentrus adspersus TaxID=1586481 RepID=A0AAV8VTY8_9CUCU|nr:hypothetical protein NQ315_002399 [Exocentrus adspersus]